MNESDFSIGVDVATTSTTTVTRPQSINGSGITTLDELREHLQWAIEVEHTTIPSYLCALYSLDSSRNAAAVEVLHSVFLEEMLHLSLAANLLNAVGGRPELDSARLLPPYPRALPHSDPPIEISLLPFGRDALRLFLRIERPCTPEAPAEDDRYETIGQFYEAIRLGLLALTDELGESAVFCGDHRRQIADKRFRGGPGRIFKVTGLETALAALALIVVQGEGTDRAEVWDGDHDMFHAERDAVGHYYRFQQLEVGRQYRRGDTPISGPTGDVLAVDWNAVLPMVENPRVENYEPGDRVHRAMNRFNTTYCDVLHLLERTFNGEPDTLTEAIATMFHLKGSALVLMKMPVGPDGATAGPSFEYVRPEDRR